MSMSMGMNSEDSLNERSEDMDSLRLKLGGAKRIEEPSNDQLVATGEKDPNEVESDSGSGLGNNGAGGKDNIPSREVALPSDKQLGIRKQIEKRLLEGATRDELAAEGYDKGSIRTIASEIKSKLGSNRPIGKNPVSSQKGLAIFAKGSPPEAIIDSIEIPDVTDGAGVPFEQGIKFGMSLIVLGVRVAQELSGMGITQAKPILDMAKAMREGEAAAAKSSAADAAMQAAGMVADELRPALVNLQRSGGDGGGGADPVKAMMVRLTEPIMKQLMSGVMGGLLPGIKPPPQITDGKDAQPSTNADGWTRRSE